MYMSNDFEQMGIYQLRNLARQMGVEKPTSKRKSQLIKEICLIKCKKIMPKKQSKVGRPPLHPFENIVSENYIINNSAILHQLFLLQNSVKREQEIIKKLIKKIKV